MKTSTPGPLKIFFSAGEPSGDLHGANLIRALQQRHEGFQAIGFGGPLMQETGCRLVADLTALAVMWFLRALLNLHRFAYMLYQANCVFRDERPDAVVLIDFPGFNWWVARRAKAHGIPVFYYCPPQVWAWASWRVKKMRRLVDHVLCSLPFEAQWFNDHGCHATFVGHPFFDEVTRHPMNKEFVESMKRSEANNGPLVTILPGSRTQEVTKNLPYFLKAAAKILAQVPNVRFAIAAHKQHQADWAQEQVVESGLPIPVHVGKTPELMQAADCCLAVSGSVSLELLYHTRPTVILYWISSFAYFVQGYFRKVKYITLVNLLSTNDLYPADITPYDPSQPGAEKVLFPEYLTCEDRSDRLAQHITEWLTDRQAYGELRGRLETLKAEICHGGASNTAADYIVNELTNSPTNSPAKSATVPGPHFGQRGQKASHASTNSTANSASDEELNYGSF